jgi:predicted glycoside hydrolase/deacetylase ChbG (UPF0249 family)
MDVAAPRRIRLCADDYGIAPGVSRAIRNLIEQGRLNATSVMMSPLSFSQAEADALAKLNTGGRRVAIGLHLTMTAPFVPLTAAYRQAGGFAPIGATLIAAMMRRLDGELISAEVEAQFGAFEEAFGRPPDFVDGHQHVHLCPQVREAVLAATARLAPGAWVRQCGAALSAFRLLSDPKGLLIDRLSGAFRKRAVAVGIATNPAFAGTYSYTDDADITSLFPGFLEGLPDGGLIMCHPGFVDDELVRLDPLTRLREREYAYFSGTGFPATLASLGVALA